MSEEIKEYLPFLIPLLIVQLSLMGYSLYHVFKHDRYKVGNRALWAIVCALVSIIGPVLYFVIGKEDE